MIDIKVRLPLAMPCTVTSWNDVPEAPFSIRFNKLKYVYRVFCGH